mgnify:CR=1 FL=1
MLGDVDLAIALRLHHVGVFRDGLERDDLVAGGVEQRLGVADCVAQLQVGGIKLECSKSQAAVAPPPPPVVAGNDDDIPF